MKNNEHYRRKQIKSQHPKIRLPLFGAQFTDGSAIMNITEHYWWFF